MEEYHLPQEIEPKLNKLPKELIREYRQCWRISARDGTGMTGVTVGMQLSPSDGGGQGQRQGLMDPFEQEYAQKRSRIEHGEADYDERHNLKKTTTAQEKVGIMVRLMAMKDNGVRPSKPLQRLLSQGSCFHS